MTLYNLHILSHLGNRGGTLKNNNFTVLRKMTTKKDRISARTVQPISPKIESFHILQLPVDGPALIKSYNLYISFFKVSKSNKIANFSLFKSHGFK